jgi:hypothetical protein
MRTRLRDDPAVIIIAKAMNIDRDAVVGKLHAVWAWATDQLSDGRASVALLSHIDDVARATGFAQAMSEAGWLSVNDDAIEFPHWERHLSEGAKHRALNTERQRVIRSQNCRASVAQKARPEKRREEKKNTPPQAASGGGDAPRTRERNVAWDAICAVWGMNPVTEKEKRRVGDLARDYNAKGATQEEIGRRIARYRKAWPNISIITPDAILKHWDQLATEPGKPEQTPQTIRAKLDRELTEAERACRTTTAARVRAEIAALDQKGTA